MEKAIEIVPFDHAGRHYEIRRFYEDERTVCRVYHEGQPLRVGETSGDVSNFGELERLHGLDSNELLVDQAKKLITERF